MISRRYRQVGRASIKLSAALCMATAVIIAGSHARYALIKRVTISIEAPSQSYIGQKVTVGIYASGLPLGAGVSVSIDGSQAPRDIKAINRGLNTFHLEVGDKPGNLLISARLYAVDQGDPDTCAVLTPSQVIWMPPSPMCLSEGLSSVRHQIEVSRPLEREARHERR